MSTNKDIAILGVGMHPWGKWGKNFVEYGVVAARAALADAGVNWRDVQFVSGAATIRNGYPGQVAGATFAQALGWQGAQVNTSYAACASGSQALAAARSKILSGECEVALVIGADTTPKGFLKPQPGERPDDPDWVRFRLGITNPTYFALYARRRMEMFGDTQADFALVKVKNAEHGFTNINARYRKKFTAADVAASAMVADPLRLMDICATSDGAAAIIVSSLDYAKKIGKPNAPRVAAISTVTPTFASEIVEMPDIATDSAVAVPAQSFRAAVPRMSVLPRSTICPPRWKWTGWKTCSSARAAMPPGWCAKAPQKLAAVCRSTLPVASPALAKRFPLRHWRRSAN
jgi:acetyl-CoA acetyltransferase